MTISSVRADATALLLEWKCAQSYVERYAVGRAQQKHAVLEREFARLLHPRLEFTKQFVNVAALVADSGEDRQIGVAGEARFAQYCTAIPPMKQKRQ